MNLKYLFIFKLLANILFLKATNHTRTTVLFLFALEQAFEVDKPLGDATRNADFTMEVVTVSKI